MSTQLSATPSPAPSPTTWPVTLVATALPGRRGMKISLESGDRPPPEACARIAHAAVQNSSINPVRSPGCRPHR